MRHFKSIDQMTDCTPEVTPASPLSAHSNLQTNLGVPSDLASISIHKAGKSTINDLPEQICLRKRGPPRGASSARSSPPVARPGRGNCAGLDQASCNAVGARL
jgi:hypothetical protein